MRVRVALSRQPNGFATLNARWNPKAQTISLAAGANRKFMLTAFHTHQKGNLNTGFQVFAFLRTRGRAAWTASASERIATAAEHSTQNVIHVEVRATTAAESLPAKGTAAGRTIRDAAPVFAKLVVLLPLVRIAQNFVRLSDFSELLLSTNRVRIRIRMIFASQLLISFADIVG